MLDATAWTVLVGGVTLIAFVLWYFFGERDFGERDGTPGTPTDADRS